MHGKLRGAITTLLLVVLVASAWWARGYHAAGGASAERIHWGTSAVGSAGHRAMTGLALMLSRELPDLSIDVVPTASALASIRGYALGDFDAYYGADIAFREYAGARGRFAGFPAVGRRAPVQSFWAYTVEVGVLIHTRDGARFNSWRDLHGASLFTGPAAWDVRAHLDLALAAVGIEYRYRELDTGLAGSALNDGTLDGFIIYTAGGAAPAAWVAEAMLVADGRILNPDAADRERMDAAGIDLITLPASVFRRGDDAGQFIAAPFHYGFHAGADIDADTVYRMLVAIERNADDLARADSVFAQVAANMAGLQQRAVARNIAHTRVHPGLARWMREHGVWNPAWDAMVANP